MHALIKCERADTCGNLPVMIKISSIKSGSNSFRATEKQDKTKLAVFYSLKH